MPLKVKDNMTSNSYEVVGLETPRGDVRGLVGDGVRRFAGIRFAEPPTGERRFAPPVPTGAHEGVLDATAFKSISPQNPSMMDAMFGTEPEAWDEDCLHLNVWTPTATPDEPLPVMVWIHGGGFEMGSGSSPIYNGGSFARSGVVYVSLNYRLGSLGFLELGHLDPDMRGSANVGLLDQVEALRWVSENIASFGGDPDNVTIFGESAGAMSVSALLTMPSAQGLFHKAIAQSGALGAVNDMAHAAMTADEFIGFTGVDSIDELREAPIEDLLAAHAKMSAGRIADPEEVIKVHGSPLAFLPFRPVADGTHIPTDPLAELKAGRAAKVPLLTGTNLEEWKLFSLMMPQSADRDALAARISLLGADPDAVIDAYESDHPNSSIAEMESAILTDAVFRVAAGELVDAHIDQAPVWQYRFDWRTPAMGGALGACHALEIPFVFDIVTDKRLEMMVGPVAPERLARDMHESWVSFARHGSPRSGSYEWPAVEGERRPVLCFGDETVLHEDPLARSRKVWSVS